MTVTKDIRYLGVNDHRVDLFEGQYQVPRGMAYNSYAILDEKVAVFDTVEAHFGEEWFENIARELTGRAPDYLIVQHMEPDHSANIAAFMKKYPAATVVASARAFGMMKNFFGEEFADRRIAVGEGDTLCLGRHTLTFVVAPMVHWPEVIMTYDATDKVLFSADAFGKFGALDEQEPWLDEARRYYIGIVGKYGPQVQAVLKKAAALEPAAICPLHGPVLTENLPYYLGLYNTWSAYGVEKTGVLVCYTSVYGHTKEAALFLAEELKKQGVPVVCYDLARCDRAAAVADAFSYGRVILATTTYNAEIYPAMKAFIDALTERNFSNRAVGLIENGSWAPVAAKEMAAMLAGCKNLRMAAGTVHIKSAMTEQNKAELAALADEICRI